MDAAIIMKRTLQDGNRFDMHRIVEVFSPSRSTARPCQNGPWSRPEDRTTFRKYFLGD